MLRLDFSAFDRWLGLAATLALAGTPACAHQQKKDAQAKQSTEIRKLQSRLEELEKTNGRLSVRVDEMEDEIFLLQDRVEAHRLALQRRKRMRQSTRGESAQAPSPAPQTNYGAPRQNGRYQVRGYNTRRRGESKRTPQRSRGRRIPLSQQQARGTANAQRQQPRQQDQPTADESGHTDGKRAKNGRVPAGKQTTADKQTTGGSAGASSGGSDSDSIVITHEDFQRFAKKQKQNTGGSAGGGSSSKSSSSSGTKRAKERVTEEKLATSDQVGDESGEETSAPTNSSDGPSAGANFSEKSGLDLYKSALAKYRSGEYATALRGFQQFLDGKPRIDYRDNGLYWIGECHFGLGDFKTAVEYFQRVLEKQPDGNKVPDAMLKMALAYRELGLQEKARGLLEKLTRRYPSTNAGRLGKKKLSDLNS